MTKTVIETAALIEELTEHFDSDLAGQVCLGFGQPVRRGEILPALARADSYLTYARGEFCANVLLLVPFGALVALLLRVRRYLVVGAWAGREHRHRVCVQWIALPARTPGVYDALADTIGTALGYLIVQLGAAIRACRAPDGRVCCTDR